jgi:hypothetical protein
MGAMHAVADNTIAACNYKDQRSAGYLFFVIETRIDDKRDDTNTGTSSNYIAVHSDVCSLKQQALHADSMLKQRSHVNMRLGECTIRGMQHATSD